MQKSPFVVRSLLGSLGQHTNNFTLHSPNSILTLPDGSIVFGDQNFIRRLNTNSQGFETLLELPAVRGGKYYLALDSANNNLYVALNDRVLKVKKMEKVRDTKTNYRNVVGCDTDCSDGDNKAKSMKFTELKGVP